MENTLINLLVSGTNPHIHEKQGLSWGLIPGPSDCEAIEHHASAVSHHLPPTPAGTIALWKLRPPIAIWDQDTSHHTNLYLLFLPPSEGQWKETHGGRMSGMGGGGGVVVGGVERRKAGGMKRKEMKDREREEVERGRRRGGERETCC